MYEEEDLSPSEKALESALGQLKPIANSMSRDVLMFKAGRMSAGSKRPWQILSSTLFILLFCSVLLRLDSNVINNVPTNSEQNHIQVVQVKYQPTEINSYDSMAYPRLVEKFLDEGLDGLDFHQVASNNQTLINQRDLLDSLMKL